MADNHYFRDFIQGNLKREQTAESPLRPTHRKSQKGGRAETSNGGRRARKRGSDRSIADLPPSPPILTRTRKDSTPTDSDDQAFEELPHTMEVADDEMPQAKARRSDAADMDIQEDEPKAKKKDTHPALEKRQADADLESLRNACKVLNQRIAESQDELAKLASGPARTRKGPQAKKLDDSIKQD